MQALPADSVEQSVFFEVERLVEQRLARRGDARDERALLGERDRDLAGVGRVVFRDRAGGVGLPVGEGQHRLRGGSIHVHEAVALAGEAVVSPPGVGGDERDPVGRRDGGDGLVGGDGRYVDEDVVERLGGRPDERLEPLGGLGRLRPREALEGRVGGTDRESTGVVVGVDVDEAGRERRCSGFVVGTQRGDVGARRPGRESASPWVAYAASRTQTSRPQ